MNLKENLEYIMSQGRTIKCYTLTSDQKLLSAIDHVCEKLGVETQHLPVDRKLLSENILAENIDIVNREGFVIIALDVAGLGEKALELRNFWRVDPATIDIPFLYLMDGTGLPLPREYNPIHGYEEFRSYLGRSIEIELGILVMVAREEYYRENVKKRPNPA